MKRLLFVDSEPEVLQCLRQALWRQQSHWHMEFVGSGAAALAALAQQPFDALITDTRLTGMEGPELLAKVRELHPQVVRLSFSGRIDGDACLRSVALTHQLLAKPCNAEQLRDVLERACALRGILEDASIRELVGALTQLPSTPHTFRALTEVIARPNAHTADISAIVSQDTALAVKTLQIVNSAYFGLRQSIRTINAAVTYVGMEMIKALSLSACVFAAVDASAEASRLLHDLQTRSIAKARLARALLSSSRHAEEAFTAALLLDIGQAVLALSKPERFAQALELARARGCPLHESEAQLFGVAHPQIGAYLLSLWGLPLELIEAVAYHHAPSQVEHQQTEVLAAVHVADTVIDSALGASERLMDRLDAQFVDRTEVARCLHAWKIDPGVQVSSLRESVAYD